jgi:2-desacetyl-2-hydroxyethyl bacteriochlorophyllide A dehydrogenase
MRAAFINRYGSADELQVGILPKPELRAHDVLVRVHASSVNPVDWKFRQGVLKLGTGFNFPIQLGKDLAGEVSQVGASVRNFKPGDQVWGMIGGTRNGAYAEFAVVPEQALGNMPASLNYQQAATIPLAGLTALQALCNRATVQKGDAVLINGASGGVGTMAVQIAAALGAEVTAVCSEKNRSLVKDLGAKQVINYQQEDFRQGNTQYDIILDLVGNAPFEECAAVLTPKGTHVTAIPHPATILTGYVRSFFSAQKQKVVIVQALTKDLDFLKELVENGQLKPIIDRTYPLSEIAEAHRYSEAGHSRGKISIDVMAL